MEKPNSQLFATKKRVYIRWERLVSDIGSEAEGLMAIIELNGKILDKGIRKKKIRMHEPCANLEFSAFAIRGKVTHAPKLSIVQAFDKKKRQEKRRFLPCLATSGVSNIYDVTATLLTAKIRSNNTLFISEFNATSAPKHSLHTALICTNI